jgi:hypothetical protein
MTAIAESEWPTPKKPSQGRPRHCNGEGCLIESRVPVGRGGTHESPAEDFPVAWLRSLLSFKPLAAVGNHFKGFRRA